MLALFLEVHDARYAVPCGGVYAVIPRVVLRPLPNTPEWFAGVFVYRGNVTPVIDLSRLIGGYPCPDRLSSRIVLVPRPEQPNPNAMVGLLTERVTEAVRLTSARTPDASHPDGSYLGEVVLEGSLVIQMLDVDAICRRAEGLVESRATHAAERDRSAPQP